MNPELKTLLTKALTSPNDEALLSQIRERAKGVPFADVLDFIRALDSGNDDDDGGGGDPVLDEHPD